MMKIFVDSAKCTEIKKWVDAGIADGVTTNPSIMFKDCIVDIEKGAKDIARLINPLPLSVEVTTNDRKEMIEQAEEFNSWAPNIVIKIPVINQYGEPCMEVISKLSKKNIKTNITAILSLSQLVLATKAGGTYVSIFAGRIGDEGGNAAEVIRQSREWLDNWGYKSEIIVGSIRSVYDVQTAIVSGAHVVTIPPAFLDKMCDHKYTRDTVKMFVDDAQKTLAQLKEGKVK